MDGPDFPIRLRAEGTSSAPVVPNRGRPTGLGTVLTTQLRARPLVDLPGDPETPPGHSAHRQPHRFGQFSTGAVLVIGRGRQAWPGATVARLPPTSRGAARRRTPPVNRPADGCRRTRRSIFVGRDRLIH